MAGFRSEIEKQEEEPGYPHHQSEKRKKGLEIGRLLEGGETMGEERGGVGGRERERRERKRGRVREKEKKRERSNSRRRKESLEEAAVLEEKRKEISSSHEKTCRR